MAQQQRGAAETPEEREARLRAMQLRFCIGNNIGLDVKLLV